MPVVTLKSRSRGLEETVAEYQSLKRKIEDLESLLNPLKEKLKEAVEKAPGMKLDVGPYRLALVEIEQERFNLKEAKERIDAKILKPFIAVSSYTRLQVK